MTQQYIQMPTKEEFKAQLTAAIQGREWESEEVKTSAIDGAVAKYKADLAANSPQLTREQFDIVNGKVDAIKARAVPPGASDELAAKMIPQGLLDQTRRDLIKAEQFRITDPEQAAIIDSLNPVESFMVGAGASVTKMKGVLGQEIPEEDRLAIEQLEMLRPSSVVGGLFGDTAPWVMPGAQVAKIASLPIRAVAAGTVGAAEGFTIARGEGTDAGKGAAIGGVITSGLELGIPIFGRLGGALFRKLTGKAPQSPVINDTGDLSEEFLSTIHENGLTPDDFAGDVQNVISGQGNDELANAVEDTATAIKSQSGRDLKAIAARPDIDPIRLASAERLGVAEQIPLSVLSRDQQFIELEQGLTSIISSETSQRQVAAIKLMREKADETIEILGGNVDDAQGLSDRVLSTLMTTRDGLDEQAETLYKQIGERVPQQLNVPDISPLRRYIDKQLSEVGFQAAELSPVDKKLARFLGTEKDPKLVTYGMIDRERKRIGEQLQGKSKPFGDMAQGELKQAYSMLTDLQGQFLDSVDAGLLPSATDKESLTSLWSNAKALTKTRKELEESLVKNFGKGGEKSIIPTLEAGLMRMPRGGIANFNKAIAAVPEEMREEAVATALNRVFTSGSGQSQLNMGGFVRWYDKLNRNQTSKKELFKYLSKDGQQRMEDMYSISKGFSDALMNKKDTGRVVTLFDNFDKPNGLLDKLYYGGGGVDPGTSAVVQVVKTASNKEKQNLTVTADRLLASTPFRQMVISAMDDPTSIKALTELRALTESKVYNQWVDELPRNARVQVLSAGIIPFLLGDEEQQQEETK